MKSSLKTLASAVALAVAAGGANAAIDNGAGGNGELFFNIWDTNGSYTLDLNTSINSFESALAASGNLDLSWAADSTLTSFLATANSADLRWNVTATDTAGARRTLTTYSPPEDTTPLKNDVARSMALSIQGNINLINTGLGSNDSAVFAAGTPGYTGNDATFGRQYSGKLGFDSTGTLANNSFASGLGFMRVDSAATGIAASVLNEYMDGSAVNVWVDSNNALHIAALPVPEPESYAMLLAGLGMLGFMARRRLNNRG